MPKECTMVTFYVENTNFVKNVLDNLSRKDINCFIVTDWSITEIHFKILIGELDKAQLAYLKEYLMKEDVYEIQFS
jgi:hypothetical protein